MALDVGLEKLPLILRLQFVDHWQKTDVVLNQGGNGGGEEDVNTVGLLESMRNG